jgi:hypothetical protein
LYEIREPNPDINIVDEYFRRWIITAVEQLLNANCLTYEKETKKFTSTELGKTMARWSLSVATTKMFNDLPPLATVPEVLAALSKVSEFSSFPFKQGDKCHLNAFNKGTLIKTKSAVDALVNDKMPQIPYPIKGKVTELSDKVNIMLQVLLSGHKFSAFNLNQESETLQQVAWRVGKALADYLNQTQPKNSFRLLVSALRLAKFLTQRMLDVKSEYLKQLQGVGDAIAKKMNEAGIYTFDDLDRCNSYDLMNKIHRSEAFIKDLKDKIRKIPKYEINIEQKLSPEDEADNRATIELHIRQIRDNYSPIRYPVHAFLYAGNNKNQLLRSYKLRLDSRSSDLLHEELVLRYPDSIILELIDEEFCGIDISTNFRPNYWREEQHPNNEAIDFDKQYMDLNRIEGGGEGQQHGVKLEDKAPQERCSNLYNDLPITTQPNVVSSTRQISAMNPQILQAFDYSEEKFRGNRLLKPRSAAHMLHKSSNQLQLPCCSTGCIVEQEQGFDNQHIPQLRPPDMLTQTASAYREDPRSYISNNHYNYHPVQDHYHNPGRYGQDIGVEQSRHFPDFDLEQYRFRPDNYNINININPNRALAKRSTENPNSSLLNTRQYNKGNNNRLAQPRVQQPFIIDLSDEHEPAATITKKKARLEESSPANQPPIYSFIAGNYVTAPSNRSNPTGSVRVIAPPAQFSPSNSVDFAQFIPRL